MHRGRDPTRRNRNIGTAKQGHGADNRHVVPRRWADSVYVWRRATPHTVVTRMVWGRRLPFVVEHTRADCWHACTIEDIVTILAKLPKRHLNNYKYIDGIQGIVLRQPTRKETLLGSVWGRLGYGVDVGPICGPVIFIEAQPIPLEFDWGRRLGPESLRELERLRHAATDYQFDGRKHHLRFDLEGVRSVQLYHTLPHEVGHWADMFEHVSMPSLHEPFEIWETLWNRYYQRPSVQREEFAHRYADEFRERMRADGAIPFPRTIDEEALRSDGLRSEDFVPSP